MAQDHHRLYRDLVARGLQISQRGAHLKVTDGEHVVVASVSPSDWRSQRNLQAELARVGFIEKKPKGAGKRGRRPEQSVQPYMGRRLASGRIPRRAVYQQKEDQ